MYKNNKKWIIVKLFVDLILKYRSRIISSITMIFLASLFESLSFISMIPLFQTIITGEGSQGPKLVFVINYIKNNFGSLDIIYILMTIVLLGVIIKAAIMYLVAIKNNNLVNKLVADLRVEIIQSLFSVHLRYFKSHSIGVISNSLTGEVLRAGNTFRSFAQFVATVLQCLMYIALAISVSVKLAIFAVACAVLLNFIFKSHTQKVYNSGNMETSIIKQLSGNFSDTLQGIKYLKAMGASDVSKELFINNILKLDQVQSERNRSVEFIKSFQEPIILTVIISSLFLNYYFNYMPIIDFFIFAFLFQRFLSRFQIAQEYQQEIYNLSGSYWGISDLIIEIKKSAELVHEGGLFPINFNEIIFENVSFVYDREFVFSNLSFVIPSKSLVGIRGSSGSGKTTLVDLIGRLETPTSGLIYLDKLDVKEIDVKQWRARIGYVPQEMFLLNDTILNNIVLGQNTVTLKDAEEALRLAGIWDFVLNLTDGINTVVGERGSLLSGGQRQRISFARAIARKPSILIVDEIAASLDQLTARDIYARLKEMSSNMLIFAISHQEEIFKYCDTVIEISKQSFTITNSATGQTHIK